MTAILEDAQEIKISEWGTLNTAASPNKLPEGHSPNNQNVWMDEKPGSVITANGYRLLGTIPSGNPPTFGIEFFKTSDGTSKFVVSDGMTVWWTTDFEAYSVIASGLSEFFQLRGAVVRDKLWLVNGSDPVMVWDGTTLTTLDGSGGTPNVPKGKYIAYHDERVWLYGIDGDLSSLRFSALANTSGTEISPENALAWPADNEIQISEGDADIGTGMWLYRGYLYCSKQFSVWRIVGSDEYDYTRVKTRASTGTRFQESVQIKDNLVHFVGVDGGYVFDGEEATRITDIIDPSAAGAFAFRSLQQPLLNNQFWNVSETADFNVGTVPRNLSTLNGQLALAADDSQADFVAGTPTNVTADINPGNLQLAYQGLGGSTINVALGGSTGLTGGVSGMLIGSPASINDNSDGSACGYEQSANGSSNIWEVVFPSLQYIGKVRLSKVYMERQGVGFDGTGKIQYTMDGSTWADVPGGAVAFPASHGGGIVARYPNPTAQYNNIWLNFDGTDVDLVINFPIIRCLGVRLFIVANFGGQLRGAIVIRELQAFRSPYILSGSYLSRVIDYVAIPATYGTLAAVITANGETFQFFTQSSADGITWDVSVNVVNGGVIGSVHRRYLRWGVTLASSTGDATPVIDKVYVGSTYISEVHDTGGNIFRWAALQASMNKAGQTVSIYFRAAASPGGLATLQPWIAIVPGAVPGADPSASFIQIKVEFSTIDAAQTPSLQSFTINWILSSGTGVNTLQNIASVVWRNRYWLSAAQVGSQFNDIVLVLGKSTSKSPWHKKDFQILMFCRYQAILIGGSSTDGSLYKLETGFSKAGAAMYSFYETSDKSKENFILKGRELLVTADRTGPYNLNVGWSTDGGLTWTDKLMDLTRPSGESLSYTKRFNINFMSDNARFRVWTNAADQPFSVDEVTAYYRLSPQRGSIH